MDRPQPEKFLMLLMNVDLHFCSISDQLTFTKEGRGELLPYEIKGFNTCAHWTFCGLALSSLDFFSQFSP